MKTRYWKNTLPALAACVCSLTSSAQITSVQLEKFVLAYNSAGQGEIKAFYTSLNYNTAWIQKENAGNRTILLNTLKRSAGMGLRETDYQFNYMESFRNGTLYLRNSHDSMDAEIRFTEAAIHFYNDMVYGNTKPPLGYNGLNYIPGCYNIPKLLADHLSTNTLQILISRIYNASPEIQAMENKIRSFSAVMADSSFREVAVTSSKITSSNYQLVLKLYQLGTLDVINKKISDSALKVIVKEAQQQFNLPADGVLRANILKELNVPLSARLQQLNLSINYYRWLYCLIQNQSVIVVNIPAAYIKVYRNNTVLLEMRVIVGKKNTPTPALASRVDEVILYPYWHVPHSIATRELLPAIKKNPGFIDAGNYQVLNMAGKIINPYAVNWHALSGSYFPYIIRQSTGCDNALGLLKLNFYSPLGVYLHDTPNKNLFRQNRRYFSHGCMRMEKPMEMGHLVLKNNAVAIDTLEQKGCLRNRSPVIVKADERMPVIVWYNPAGIDITGRVIFYEDAYGKFNWMQRK